MLWQDSRGNWYSTVSPIDMKIERAMIEARSNKSPEELSEEILKEFYGDSLFDQMFSE
jgi:hypothetical protein